MLSIANEQFPICEPSSSKIFKSETFPWSDLPNELRVQVMKQLSRRDINSCRRVSRMMNEIVRLNERVLRRRCLDFVCLQRVGQGRMELRMRSDDEGQRRAWRVPCKRKLSEDDKYKTKEKVLYPCQRLDSSIDSILCRLPSICDLPFSIDSRLREVMKESDVELFLLNEMKVSDSLLSAILTAFRSTGCRINRVSFELCSFKMLSPHSLIRFLTAIDPVEVTFCLIREASTPHFGRDLFRFLTSRRFFDVSEVVDDIGNDVCLGIDDDILKVSECPTFRVGRGNLITQKGVHEFCESIRSGKRMVQDVRIETETPVSEDVTTMDVTNTSFKIEIKSTNIIEIRNECISEHVY